MKDEAAANLFFGLLQKKMDTLDVIIPLMFQPSASKKNRAKILERLVENLIDDTRFINDFKNLGVGPDEPSEDLDRDTVRKTLLDILR